MLFLDCARLEFALPRASAVGRIATAFARFMKSRFEVCCRITAGLVVTLSPAPLLRGTLDGAAAGVAAERKASPAKGDTAPADVAGEADALFVGRSWKGEDSTVLAAIGSGVAEERARGEVNEANEEAEEVEAVAETAEEDETSTGGGNVGAVCPLPLRSCPLPLS